MAGTGRNPADAGEGREQGTALSIIGLGLLVAALLVVFFAPAGFRLGQQSVFLALIVVLVVLGLGFFFWGRSQRRRTS